MGLFDWIKAGAGFAAAPFTGGATLPFALQATGSALSNASAARGNARAYGDQAALDRDSLAMQGVTAQQRAEIDAIMADLEQRRYADSRRGASTQDALRGSLLQGLQDVEFDLPEGVNMATVTGGLRPSAIANRAQVGQELERQALLELMNPIQPGGIDRGGGTRTAVPRGRSPAEAAAQIGPTPGQEQRYNRQLPSIRVLDMPELSEPSKPGLFDKILGVAGPALTMYGSLGDFGGGSGGGGGGGGGGTPWAPYATGARRVPVPSTLR